MTIDRDRSTDQLLRQSRPPAAAPAAPCLEPETIAAWLDGTLPVTDRAAVEAHAAACDRCQAIVAATLRSEPALVKERSLRAPFVRWMAPLALAEAALLAWMIVAPRQTRAPAAPLADAAPAVARYEPPAEPSATASAAPEQPKVEANLKAKERLRDERAASAAASSPPAAPAAAPAPSTLAQLEKRADLDAKAQANADAGAPPKLEAARRLPQQAMREAVTIAAPALMIASPDPSVRWRVTPPGRVERSVDGGVTWTPQDIGDAVTIRAGRAVSTEVAWLVGDDGVVLVTSDGRSWLRRTLGEALALVDVTPADARTATVTAADGRRFTTRDGGATWTRATPQENPPAPF